MQYTISLDSFALWVTAIVCMVFVGVSLWNIRSIFSKANDKVTKLIHAVVLIVLLGPLVYSYLYHPQKYVIGNFDVFIKRPIGDVVIHVKDIREMRLVNSTEMDGTIRTFGVGGLFGYFGKYHNPKIGDFTMYASRQDKLVIIYTKDGSAVIITPDDPGFPDRLKMKMNDVLY
jgi:hypothetical protein